MNGSCIYEGNAKAKIFFFYTRCFGRFAIYIFSDSLFVDFSYVDDSFDHINSNGMRQANSFSAIPPTNSIELHRYADFDLIEN